MGRREVMNQEKNFLISIITPTFNRAELISRAIQSVLCQTYSNWELIIIDDHSTDETEAVVFSFDDVRLRYIRLNENLGNAGARNEGLKTANGSFITFLDSDDELLPNSLELFLKCLEEEPELNFAFGGYKICDDDSGKIIDVMWKPEENINFLEDLKIGTGCGIFISKYCLEKVGYFDPRLRIAVDTDWLIRLNKIFRHTSINDYLVIVHKHDGERVRKDTSELLKSYKIIFDKNKKDIERSTLLTWKFIYKLQWLSYHSGNTREGNNFFLKLIKRRKDLLKPIIVFLIFNLFPTELGKNLHKKMSGNRGM